ncbi:hypothetical protein LUZ60_012616 [Juncus effusus]|nr:hypothetical protein LUZ60_012616 [Juncus effusus]
MARPIHSTVHATMLHSRHLSPPFSTPFPLRSVHFLRRRLPLASTSTPPPNLTAPSPPPPEEAEPDLEGPIEINPFSTTPIFATDDNPTPIQIATSVLLTGSISVFLFRALRRRAKRLQELRVRSTGMNKASDAMESLKAIRETAIDPGQPPSPIQAFLGSIAAGVLCLILYKFTTTIETSLNKQTISDNISVRQITITIRTIINGICYLATFVFGINSAGLMLYSIQLFLNSLFENDSDSKKSDLKKKEGEELNNVGPTVTDLEQISDEKNNSSNSSE